MEMGMKKKVMKTQMIKCGTFGMALAAALVLSLPANASVDYSFSGAAPPAYYPSTNYEDLYGSRYNYGGDNIVEYKADELKYGVQSSTSTGAMEKVKTQAQALAVGSMALNYDGGAAKPASMEVSSRQIKAAGKSQYTSADDIIRVDGSIGTLRIPSLGIEQKVWEGETNESMAKGVAHYSSTSAWNGNVGMCGHNRGAKYVIGSIKDLKTGDTIIYDTVYGSRTYRVSYVGTISVTDWSYLQATSDNRITLTTCLADQPSYRVCVQAMEIL